MSIGPDYFEQLYTANSDPWDFVGSEYERRKYDATLAAVGTGHAKALEIGCSIGVLTRRLAGCCEALLAVDVSEIALCAARQRCEDVTNIRFQRMQLPDELPNERFDLILLSEVGYYWSLADLDRFLDWVRGALDGDGLFVLVHWTGETNYPLTGDQVHDHVMEKMSDQLVRVRGGVTNSYRLDVLQARQRLS